MNITQSCLRPVILSLFCISVGACSAEATDESVTDESVTDEDIGSSEEALTTCDQKNLDKCTLHGAGDGPCRKQWCTSRA